MFYQRPELEISRKCTCFNVTCSTPAVCLLVLLLLWFYQSVTILGCKLRKSCEFFNVSKSFPRFEGQMRFHTNCQLLKDLLVHQAGIRAWVAMVSRCQLGSADCPHASPNLYTLSTSSHRLQHQGTVAKKRYDAKKGAICLKMDFKVPGNRTGLISAWAPAASLYLPDLATSSPRPLHWPLVTHFFTCFKCQSSSMPRLSYHQIPLLLKSYHVIFGMPKSWVVWDCAEAAVVAVNCIWPI